MQTYEINSAWQFHLKLQGIKANVILILNPYIGASPDFNGSKNCTINLSGLSLFSRFICYLPCYPFIFDSMMNKQVDYWHHDSIPEQPKDQVIFNAVECLMLLHNQITWHMSGITYVNTMLPIKSLAGFYCIFALAQSKFDTKLNKIK